MHSRRVHTDERSDPPAVDVGSMLAADVRAAKTGDESRIADLVIAHERERGGSGDRDSARRAAHACIGHAEHDVFVADSNGLIVGYLAIHWIPVPALCGREGYVSELVVHAGWRGRGLGSRLLAAAEAKASQLGCSRLVLQNDKGTDAFRRAFFSRSGYCQQLEIVNFVKPVDAQPRRARVH